VPAQYRAESLTLILEKSVTDLQKKIALVGAGVVILTLAFPPFSVHVAEGGSINMGYSFILDPPLYGGFRSSSVNIEALLVRWIAIALVCGVASLVFREKKQ